MQDANNIGANGRYVIERVLGEQTVGRYVVAVDTVAGGRVTILVPAAQAVRPQRVVDASSTRSSGCGRSTTRRTAP
jgi:hypothetical protein